MAVLKEPRYIRARFYLMVDRIKCTLGFHNFMESDLYRAGQNLAYLVVAFALKDESVVKVYPFACGIAIRSDEPDLYGNGQYPCCTRCGYSYEREACDKARAKYSKKGEE